MTRLLVATTNAKKMGELKDLLQALPFSLQDLSAFTDIHEVPEDGNTFEENAAAKAAGYAAQTGLLTLAEDSGLCCEALELAPGVYSARFAGPAKEDQANNEKVLRLLGKMPDNCRRAYFKSAVALAEPGRMIGTVTGEVHGYISRKALGENGFGYDSIFYYPPFQKTFGQVSKDEKYRVSHRAQALQKAKELLKDYLSRV